MASSSVCVFNMRLINPSKGQRPNTEVIYEANNKTPPLFF